MAVPMKDASPGPVNLEIYQFGLEKPDRLPLTAYAEAAVAGPMTLSAGDTEALFKGNRLDEVAKVTLKCISWTPAALSRVRDSDQLTLTADSPPLRWRWASRSLPMFCCRMAASCACRQCRAAPSAGDAAQQGRAGGTLRSALAGAAGQPGRPAG